MIIDKIMIIETILLTKGGLILVKKGKVKIKSKFF